MSADIQQIKLYLKNYEFARLFREELGWNQRPETPHTIPHQRQEYKFTQLAEKRGFKIYLHTCVSHIPPLALLKQLDEKLDSLAAAHLTIFVDAQQENQLWLWIKRQGNKVTTYPTRLNKLQSGELLAQKIRSLFVSLEEEEKDELTLIDILNRVMQGFDVEKVTQNFYKGFESQHGKFLEHIRNIPDEDDRKWYTSIMLNRLMFVYFIQRKGLLNNYDPNGFNGDDRYLQDHLEATQKKSGDTNTFYRDFLCPLFHEGLNKRERPPELKQLIGDVPYLNGGIFDLHYLEKKYRDIQISNEAFESLFTFFTKFTWHLDDRPARNDNEINPDVLGYIFEKYINQKQMGAYYTKEDITGYIGKNTIIPYIFERTAQQHPDAFAVGGPVWSLLQDSPDDYIYESMTHGLLEDLPENIMVGIDDVNQRAGWNQSADEQWALPTETWREVVARRQRYQEVRDLLAEGRISTINDLITYNLNITQFAADTIATCTDLGLLRAFYDIITHVTILDPTCGSGAFLFAALNILKPLYQACIQQMRMLVEEYNNHRKSSNHVLKFQELLAGIDQRKNPGYFTLKSIIVNNLYGVDIMEEAIEICKLRFFLNMIAQLETPEDLEPLPDIDFNVLAGNTLIGFTSMGEVRRVVTEKLVKIGNTEETLANIEWRVKEIEREEQSFREMQIRLGKIDSTILAEHKQRLRTKLDDLRNLLNPYLATEYGIDRDTYPDEPVYEEKYEAWKKNYQPFHWWAEFYKIVQDGGFDVIIGNPPYVERSEFKKLGYTPKGFTTERCSDIYAMFLEQSINLINNKGLLGFIIPISFICADDFAPLQELLLKKPCVKWAAHFANRPSQLFIGAQKRLTILIMGSEEQDQRMLFTSRYRRWVKEERDSLIPAIEYVYQNHLPIVFKHSVAKIGSELEYNLAKKVFIADKRIGVYTLKNSSYKMYYVRTPGYFCQFLKFPPMTTKLSTQETKPRGELYCDTFKIENESHLCMAVANSNLFYWYFTVYSDCRHMNRRDVLNFPFDLSKLNNETCKTLIQLSKELQEDYIKNKSIMNKSGLEIETFSAYKSKPIIDEIDRVLAQHYGFTPEELDFIINYDIKYRMGRDNGDESEE